MNEFRPFRWKIKNKKKSNLALTFRTSLRRDLMAIASASDKASKKFQGSP